MAEILIPLETERYFHIYNHAIGTDNLFNTATDYYWFLDKLKKYILPFSDVFAYCLMPNHFHLVVRIKNDEQIKLFLSNYLKVPIRADDLINKNENYISDILSKQFSNFFNAYAKHYNFTKQRKGTLFKRAFRRKLIDNMDYLQKIICYVHQNPVASGFCGKIDEWKYSSYNAIITSKPTLVERKEVVELFDDLKNFIFCNS